MPISKTTTRKTTTRRPTAKMAEQTLLKAYEDFLVSKGASKIALKSKAERFSRLQKFSETSYGTFKKPVGDFGKFYSYGGMSYNTLRVVSKRALLMQAIMSVRKFQILSISRKIKDFRKDIGWRIIPKNFYEKNAKTSDAEMKRAKEIEDWLMTPHAVFEPSLSDFMVRFVNEHLTINRVAIELYKDNSGRLQGFGLIDGALLEPTFITMKHYIDNNAKEFQNVSSLGSRLQLATEKLNGQYADKVGDIKNIDFLYFVDGIPQAAFRSDEVMVIQTDVPVDIKQYGFPSSKVEDAISGIVSFLNMWAYNDRAFTGSMLDTILAISGTNVAPDADTFTVIEEALQAYQGVQNSFKIPLIEMYDGSKIEAIQLGKGNRDMQFDKILQASVSLVAGVFRMNPNEFNIKGFSGEGQALYEASQDYAMTLAKKEGFGSEVVVLEDALQKIVTMYDANYTFEFFGLNKEDEDKKAKTEQITVTYKYTPNELRLMDGLDSIDEKYCKKYGLDPNIIPFMNLPFNQGLQIAYQQTVAQRLQQEQQEQQAKQQQEQGDQGDQGEDGENGGQPFDEGDVDSTFNKSIEALTKSAVVDSKIFEDFGFTNNR